MTHNGSFSGYFVSKMSDWKTLEEQQHPRNGFYQELLNYNHG